MPAFAPVERPESLDEDGVGDGELVGDVDGDVEVEDEDADVDVTPPT